jgi:hypothetical protein
MAVILSKYQNKRNIEISVKVLVFGMCVISTLRLVNSILNEDETYKEKLQIDTS